MTAKTIAGFSKFEILPLLGEGFCVYTKRDLVRMRGPFVQAVLFAKKRSGWLITIPTFYVAGADPSSEVLSQTMSLPMSGLPEDRRWLFSPRTVLDADLARRLAVQLQKDSPISFLGHLDDVTICTGLNRFAQQGRHWAPALSRAFFSMCSGSSTAAEELMYARNLLIKFSRFGRDRTLLNYERALVLRLNSLEERLQSSDCVMLCRAEAEEHANRLNLPAIVWPSAWPTIHSPTQSPKSGWLTKLLKK